TLQDHYQGSSIVGVHDGSGVGELLLNDNDPAPDRLELYVFANENGALVRLAAKLDNLGTGAAGSTVQDLNIMAGLDETLGLRLSHSRCLGRRCFPFEAASSFPPGHHGRM